MKRRTLIKSISALAAIPLFGTRLVSASELPADASMTFAPASWRVNVALKILSESGDMWLASADRWRGLNPILVAFDDASAVEIRRSNNHWKLLERPLTNLEVEELTTYKHGLYHIQKREPRIGDRIEPHATWRLRAYIKNGRRPGWIMSGEKVA